MKNKVYAQLYSLLRTNQDDLISSLQTFSSIGYDGVELMGTYFAGLSLDEYKSLLSELKLDPISSHGLRGEKDYEIASELGVKFTDIRADIHEENTREEILRACDALNSEGRTRAKFGLKAVLHNHAHEFKWVAGEVGKNRIYDLMLQNTDPEYVSFEFDVGWGAFAGIDPVSFILKYPGRFPLIHVKETNRLAHNDVELEHFPPNVMALGYPVTPKNPNAGVTGIERGFSFFTEQQARMLYEARTWNVQLGKGIINWTELVKACEDQGTLAYINEREYYSYPGGNDNPEICAAHDYEFLRSL